ncbi:MAG: PfkB family carbohydrate kinase [Vallitalea sp.]|jgi:fructose-1-phosphate kinase PfkB-like protein|nr:PfkB family carbohydrate kinase [Vallitalea sp.]
MIVTIALNPSINKLAVIDGLEVNSINNVQDYRICLGESTIYSAYTTKILQGEPYVLGFIGGIGGRYIKNFMEKSRIKSDMVFNLGESKSIYKIVDSINGTETTLLDNGLRVDERDTKNFKHKLQNHIKDAKVMIIGGELPKGTDFSLVEDIITLAKKNNLKIISAMKGQELRKSLSLNPYGVKVSKDTIAELKIFDSLEEDTNYIIKELYKILVNNRIHYMVYDAFDEGIYVISKSKICKVICDECIDISDGLGASDSLVGAFAVSIERKYEQEKMAKLIMATNISVKNSKHPNICSRKDIDFYYNKVKIVEIMNKKQGYIQ